MTEKLQKSLDYVYARVLYAPANIHITWCTPAELDGAWGRWHYTHEDGHWIGISLSLSGAPLYVRHFVIFHEVLHAVFPPRRGAKNLHSRAFRIAEHLWGPFYSAEKWLSKRCGKGCGK